MKMAQSEFTFSASLVRIGVATLSNCTDSSTASSDGSDPGSPYSPSSSSGDDHNAATKSSLTPGGTTLLPALVSSLTSKTAAMGVQAHTKATTLPHIWPWSNNFTITSTGSSVNNSAAGIVSGGAPLSSIQPPPLVKGGLKRTSEPLSQSSAASIKKMRGAMAKPLALVAAAPKLKAISASNPINNVTPMLPVGINIGGCAVGNPQTKITGFFKSQIKPVNTLKRTNAGNNGSDITGLVVRSTDFPKHPPASKSNIATSQQLINPANIQKVTCDIDVRTVHVATSSANPLQQTMASSATTMATATATTKLERKTAKVAPLVPITRKTTSNCVSTSTNVVPAKKPPVTIAPRIDSGPSKVPSHGQSILSNTRVQPLPQQMVTPMQQHQQPHQHTMPQLAIGGSIVTSLSPPALVSTSNQKNGKTLLSIYQNTAAGVQNTNNINSTHLMQQAPANMPKLVQIPNVSAQSQTQARFNPISRTQPVAIPPTQPPNTIQATSSGQETATHYFVNGALIKLQTAPSTHHQQTHLSAPKSYAIQPTGPFNPHQQLFMATSTGLLLTATSTAGNGMPTMLSSMPMPALHPYATAAPSSAQQQQQQLQQPPPHFQQQQPQQQQLQFQTLQQQLHNMSLIMPPQFAASTQQQQMIQPQLGNSSNAGNSAMQQKPQQQQQQQPIFFAHRGNLTSAFLAAGSAPFQQCPTVVTTTSTHNNHNTNALCAHPAAVAHVNTNVNGSVTSAHLPAGCATFQQQCPTVATTNTNTHHNNASCVPAVFANAPTNTLAPLTQSNTTGQQPTTTLNPINSTTTSAAINKMTIPSITRTAMGSPPPLISTNTPPPLCISKPLFVQHCSHSAQQQTRLSKCSITINTAPPPALCSVSKRTAPVLPHSPEMPLLKTAPDTGIVSVPASPTGMPSLTPIIDTITDTYAARSSLCTVTTRVEVTSSSLSNPVDESERIQQLEEPTSDVELAADRLQLSTASALHCRHPQNTILAAVSAIGQPAVRTTKSTVPPISQASPKSLVLERIQRLKPELPHPIDCSPRTPITTNTIKRLHVSTSTPITGNAQAADSLMQTPPPPSTDCAKSPILSQPKTIRFPAAAGTSRGSGARKSDGRLVGVCYWDDCSERYDTSSKLLDHLQTQHVNGQTGPFSCEWSGCKVHGRESCSRRWLERHVLLHGGTKLFKCIVDGCGLRFGSQLALQKHVNSHFNATENQKDQKDRRSSDPPVPKKLRVTGKKLRYRRQPFSARMFDFFDNGIMEVLQHRLACTEKTTCGERGAVVFVGQPIVRRVSSTGCIEHLVHWTPSDILPDEWLPENSPLFTTHNSPSPVVVSSQHCVDAGQQHLVHENLSSACSSSGASETSETTAAFSLASTSAGSSSSSSCASKTVPISCMSAAERIALHEYLRVSFARSEQIPAEASAERVELMELLATAQDGENSGSSNSSTHSSCNNNSSSSSSSSGVSSTDDSHLPSHNNARLTAQQPLPDDNEATVATVKRNRRKTTARSSALMHRKQQEHQQPDQQQQQQQQQKQWSSGQLSSMWLS